MTPSTDAHPCASEGARPFGSADDAWIWTMAALMARRDGAGPVISVDGVARPCEPDDVVMCLEDLYRSGRIDLSQVRVMRTWGERQIVPSPLRLNEREFAQLWQQAMGALLPSLLAKNIVVTPTVWMQEAVDVGASLKEWSEVLPLL
jgi:hypothetical protein